MHFEAAEFANTRGDKEPVADEAAVAIPATKIGVVLGLESQFWKQRNTPSDVQA
jgi:hypothetical protein